MTCYYKYSNTDGPVAHDYAFPCVSNAAGVVQCCDRGDVCMSDGLCEYGRSGSEKNFYVGGCTSSTFSGSACLNTCTNQNTSDIAYNATAQIWQCCPAAGSCGSLVVEDTLSAPPVNQLQSLATIATDGAVTPISSTAAPTTTSTSAGGAAGTASAGAQSAGANQPSGGLSTGATAGIAVGAVLFVLLLAAIAFFFWRKRSKRARNAEQPSHVLPPAANEPPTGGTYYDSGKQYPMSPKEKDATAAAPPELPPMTGQLRSELPTTAPSHHSELPGSDVQRAPRPPPAFEVGTEA